MNTAKWGALVGAFRPKTLTAALVPCVAASSLAAADAAAFSGLALGAALAAAFLIQIGTNLVNDAMDFRKGADNADRLGPRRITQAGDFSFGVVMGLASLCFLLAVACGLPLVQIGGAPIVVIGLVSVLMGYAYTAGPFPLAYVGLGDLFVVIFFGLVAVMGMFYLHTGAWDADAAWLGLQIGLHATVLIAVNNARDHEGDRRAGKKTLAARFGLAFARREILILALLPFAMNLYWVFRGHSAAALLSLLALPIAISLSRKVFRADPGPVYNRYLAQAAGLHLVFGLLLSAGFWL